MPWEGLLKKRESVKLYSDFTQLCGTIAMDKINLGTPLYFATLDDVNVLRSFASMIQLARDRVRAVADRLPGLLV
jgi:hypothetical protein